MLHLKHTKDVIFTKVTIFAVDSNLVSLKIYHLHSTFYSCITGWPYAPLWNLTKAAYKNVKDVMMMITFGTDKPSKAENTQQPWRKLNAVPIHIGYYDDSRRRWQCKLAVVVVDWVVPIGGWSACCTSWRMLYTGSRCETVRFGLPTLLTSYIQFAILHHIRIEYVLNIANTTPSTFRMGFHLRK